MTEGYESLVFIKEGKIQKRARIILRERDTKSAARITVLLTFPKLVVISILFQQMTDAGAD